ncbi:MAG: VWA domain-containing protein [Leptospiraceae bacterium]|nr:VWA domain-containing protein [Leptospiraceae bacterium]
MLFNTIIRARFAAIPGLIALLCAGPLLSRELRVSVLPFAVSGPIAKAGLPQANLDERLAQATAFWLGQVRDTTIDSPDNVNRLARDANWKSGQALDARQLQRTCSFTPNMFFLTGNLYVRGSALELDMRSWSCHLNHFIGSTKVSGHTVDLQSMIVRAVRQSTPFLNPKPEPTQINYYQQRQKRDLAVILDTSGSMVRDLENIYKALQSIAANRHPESRLGLIQVLDQDRLNIVPFDQNWQAALKSLQGLQASGEATLKGLEAALLTVERYRDWQNTRQLAMFTDVDLHERRQSTLEARLRSLQNDGIAIQQFELSGQSYTDRLEWQRLARTTTIKQAPSWYGRQIYTLTTSPYWILQHGNRFYQAQDTEGFAASLAQNRLDATLLHTITGAAFDRNDLNLESLSQAWPARQKQRVQSLGPIQSSLETSIVQALQSTDSVSGQSTRQALVRNQGISFWIPVMNNELLREMRRRKRFFLGIHLDSGQTQRLRVLPSPQFIRTYNDVPRLMLTTWERLNRVKPAHLKSSDVWFLELEFLDSK